MVKLAVRIGKLKLKNPVMVASGTWGAEYAELVDPGKLGAIVFKTVTLEKRVGNPPPRIAETASGMLNSIGLENGGVDDFIQNKLPALAAVDTVLVASIAGDDARGFKELARRLSKVPRVNALELNLSCPNIRYGVNEGLIAHDGKETARVIQAVRAATKLPIIAKLSPNVTDIGVIVKAAEAAGADAVSLTNTFIGMAVDIETRRPKLGNITGGLSGPAIKPLSARAVWEAAKAADIPVIGIGGIMDWRDAVEFMLCGATAVQVGTANFIDAEAPVRIVNDLEKYLRKKGIRDVNSLIGAIKLG